MAMGRAFPRRRCRPSLEGLEHREVPSSVDHFVDKFVPFAGTIRNKIDPPRQIVQALVRGTYRVESGPGLPEGVSIYRITSGSAHPELLGRVDATGAFNVGDDAVTTGTDRGTVILANERGTMTLTFVGTIGAGPKGPPARLTARISNGTGAYTNVRGYGAAFLRLIPDRGLWGSKPQPNGRFVLNMLIHPPSK